MARRSGPTDLSSRASSRPISFHNFGMEGSERSSRRHVKLCGSIWGTAQHRRDRERERERTLSAHNPVEREREAARETLAPTAARNHVLQTRCKKCCAVVHRLAPNMAVGSSFGPRCAATKVSSMRPQCNEVKLGVCLFNCEMLVGQIGMLAKVGSSGQ